jgi:hypothetical protein
MAATAFFRAPRTKRKGTLSAFVMRRSMIEETLSVFLAPRCKRFDVGKPLAPRRAVFAERLSVFVERLSIVNEPLSAFRERRSMFVETPSVLLAPRCKRRSAC